MKYMKLFENYKINEMEGMFKPMLKHVLDQINQNVTSGWIGDELGESYECVILEDVEDVDHGEDEETGKLVYNGWYENLVKLNHSGAVKNILRKIEENKIDMWRTDLEETFPCVILTDINEIGHEMIYNGWLEDLEIVANNQ